VAVTVQNIHNHHMAGKNLKSSCPVGQYISVFSCPQQAPNKNEQSMLGFKILKSMLSNHCLAHLVVISFEIIFDWKLSLVNNYCG